MKLRWKVPWDFKYGMLLYDITINFWFVCSGNSAVTIADIYIVLYGNVSTGALIASKLGLDRSDFWGEIL